MSSAANNKIDVVRRAYAVAFDRTQGVTGVPVAELLSVCDPKVVFVPDAREPDAVPHIGIGEFRRLLEASAEGWEACRYEVDELVDIGSDRVLASGRVIARGSSSIELELPFANVWTIQNGRAVRVEAYDDPTSAAAASRRSPGESSEGGEDERTGRWPT